MKPVKFYMAREEDGPDSAEWLTINGHHYPYRRDARDEEVTLEALADLFDQDAENANAHDFVLCHRGLAALLHQEVGREAATRIFRRLAAFNGLHGMGDVAATGRVSQKEVEKDLGVPLGGCKAWKLKDKK